MGSCSKGSSGCRMQVLLLSYGELASLPSYTRGTRRCRQVLHLRACGLLLKSVPGTLCPHPPAAHTARLIRIAQPREYGSTGSNPPVPWLRAKILGLMEHQSKDHALRFPLTSTQPVIWHPADPPLDFTRCLLRWQALYTRYFEHLLELDETKALTRGVMVTTRRHDT
jgi:hypothetical protein